MDVFFQFQFLDTMTDHTMFPPVSREMNEKKAALAPVQIEAWRQFSKAAFQAGAIDERTKHLIAVAVAHATQCPYCIRAHTRAAINHGASREQVMEAVWVAAEMRAGASYAHASIAMDEMDA